MVLRGVPQQQLAVEGLMRSLSLWCLLCMGALLYLTLLAHQVPLRSVSLSPERAACNSRMQPCLGQLQRLSGKLLQIMAPTP